MRHYIAMAGLLGYLPIYCDVFQTYEDAVDSLACIHELGRDRTRSLKRDGWLDLNLARDGNEYCEIIDCDCDTPQDHSEQPLDWD